MFIGRLTAAPEMKQSNSGKNFAQFTVAVSGYNKTTDYIDCVAFEKTAEFITQQCTKGERIMVMGALKVNSYKDKEGKSRKSWSIFVNTFEHCDGPKGQTAAPAPEKKDESFMNIPAGADDEGLPFN